MEGCTHYFAMVLVQLIYGGSDVLTKLSVQDGLNPVVFVVYRHVLAMVLIGPFAYFFSGIFYAFPLISSKVSCSVICLPLFRMKKLKIRSTQGQAKVAGTIFCIGGSLILTFWKGGYLLKGVEKPLINVHNAEEYGKIKHVQKNWIKGSALILISYIAWSEWLILQVRGKVYPSPSSLASIMCFFASLQSSFLALFFVRNSSSWRLEWNLQLLTIVYVYFRQLLSQSDFTLAGKPKNTNTFSPFYLAAFTYRNSFTGATRVVLPRNLSSFFCTV
ncbi:unnamed protein product [Malus baccata var. baccata]